MKKSSMVFLACLVLTGWISAAGTTGGADGLVSGFTRPPDSARPWVYWTWMDGNLSREGITSDLEAMRKAGIGGVVIFEVNVGIPRGPVNFMSPEWRKLFAHVVSEAERLGLEITLNAGPGWTGSGGPWVKPEQSMQHIVASALDVTGPRRFDGTLPRPQRWPAFFGDGLLPPDLEKIKNDFYLDTAVLAFPTPAAGPGIGDIGEKALYVRAPYSSQPGVKPFLPSPAVYPATPAGAAIDLNRVIDLSGRLSGNGRLVWDVPEGRWTVLRFGRTSTGATTRPAPVPGLGLECDKLDKAALDAQFAAFISPLLKEIGTRKRPAGVGWTMLHIDSWEMGAQNWTEAFREEFRRRRGYDLLPYLPAMTGRIVSSIEVSERFLWDLRQTAQELLIENHAAYLRELGRRNGFGLSIEPYDMTPCSDMSLGRVADVPMGEFWLYGFNTAHSVIEAASVAHTGGRSVVAAESFTSGDAEAWRAHPESMKALGDWAFTAGVNRIVFHRYQHQAVALPGPGMTMGPYGVHWERTQSWWNMVPAFHRYLTRSQFLLRRGLPVADVCYLVAEGAPHVFRAPASAMRGSPPDHLGYNFDGCAPETVLADMTVKEGKLVLPDGMSYRVLVLPERETMTPLLLRKIKELVSAGATVIGPRPWKSPGLSGYPACDDEVKRIAGEIWGDCDGATVTEHAFGRGRVLWMKERPVEKTDLKAFDRTDKTTWNVGAPPLSEPSQYGDFATVERVLAGMGIGHDFDSNASLRYIHRAENGTDIYFIANPAAHSVQASAVFRVSGKRPELWDAVTGAIRDLPEFSVKEGLTSVPIRFEPHQSFFVVFRKTAAGPAPAVDRLPQKELRVELAGSWKVSFDPGKGGPANAVFNGLEDWSRRPEEGIRYYSGEATYRKSFDLPSDTAAVAGGKPDRRWWLDLGTVKNLARVRLNGRDLGVVWCAPWRVEITSAVRSKGNRLEIVVANLWPNRLIGDEQLPPDAEYGKDGDLLRWPEWVLKKEPRPSRGRVTFATWKLYKKDSPLLPSGLIGPVTLTTALWPEAK